MNSEINYQNNPLHGVSLENLLIEMTSHYSFEILFAYLNINCFKSNPSIVSSVKFLKKTDWAREKVEAFYLYEFKSLPRVSSEQFLVPPRERIIPEGQVPGEPAELSLEDAERLREKRAKKSAEYNQEAGYRPRSGKGLGASRKGHYKSGDDNGSRHGDHGSSNAPRPPVKGAVDPWARSKNISKD